jgi:hypothetical protein
MRRLLALSTTALLLGTAGAILPAGPALAATWSTVSSPNASTGLNVLAGIDALATNNAWAVGRADHSPSAPFERPLVLRWNGTSWAQSSTPALSGDALLNGVDGSAANQVWAVGSRTVPAGGGSSTAEPLTERWNGTAWSVVPSAKPAGSTGSALTGVKTFSATSAWAVGSYNASGTPFARTLIERWNGTAWSVVPSPNPDPQVNLLSDVDGATADDVWAIGNIGNDGYGGTVAGIVLRWNGTAWQQVTVPGATSDATLRQPVLNDVHVRSADDVWIVGRAFHFGLFRMVPIFMHWNGTSWQNGFVNGAPAGGFNGVTALSPTKVYAVGDVTARWNGTAWSLESTAFPGPSLDAAATGTGTVWGAGSRYDPGLATFRTLTVRTTNG